MEELVIREAHNLVSTYSNCEGKEKVVSKGNCPMCGLVIEFTQSIERKDWSEALASNLYECFLMNNELCFNCRHLCEAWIREHKELCLKHNLQYRDIGNKVLEKQGKLPIIGVSNEIEEEEIVDDSAIVEENAPKNGAVPSYNQVNNEEIERRLLD